MYVVLFSAVAALFMLFLPSSVYTQPLINLIKCSNFDI